MTLPDMKKIRQQVQNVLDEDIGSGDLTAELLPASQISEAAVICRETAVIAGCVWFEQSFLLLDPSIEIKWQVKDGQKVEPNATVATLRGPSRALLSAERSALNFLQTLSGTATRVALYVDAVKPHPVRILDTRKSLPGLREAQKYAVTCGGGSNHRFGLWDMILIKENHILSAGSVKQAIEKAHQLHPEVELEIEVETLQELEEALTAGAKRILLDNMKPDTLRQAVELNQSRARLEASGGITLNNIREIAATGVDDISLGVLTKDVTSIDFSMRIYSIAN